LKRKVNVSACIEAEDLERLEDLSRRTGKSISSIICRAVKEFLEKEVEVVEENDDRS
jgi:predicted DNA-binding protein